MEGQVGRKFRSAQSHVSALKLLTQQPENRIDLAGAKIAIDQIIDPAINGADVLRQVEELTASIRRRFRPTSSKQEKLEILVNSLAQSGPWNGYRPFSYDLRDPMGGVIKNKLLSTYLATRKGNCVSMPVLMVILGQKLGLDMTLATAPEHVLVKFRGERGLWINVEATSFGSKHDSSYQRELGITQRAVANRLYLTPLSKRESVGVMMGALMEALGEQGRQEQRIAIADVALAINAQDVSAMLQKGNAYYRMLKVEFLSKYPSPAAIPPKLRPRFQMLGRNNIAWFEKAEALGWTMPPRAAAAVPALSRQVRNHEKEVSPKW